VGEFEIGDGNSFFVAANLGGPPRVIPRRSGEYQRSPTVFRETRFVNHKFQVHLLGLIDLLSNHLYSGPHVFVRELLQNGVDAIRARQALEPQFSGEITIELTSPAGSAPTLTFADNGVGLSEDEVHRFLAIIGESSKRPETGERPADFIGQFGIGLLACFLVSDEIVVVSRSARGTPAVEWRGRPDGTFQLRTLEQDLAPGTQVFLNCKSGAEEFFESDRLLELVQHYGGLLPVPIRVRNGRGSQTVGGENLPWRGTFADALVRERELLEFGQELFGMRFFDAIPLRAAAGDVEGVAFVMAQTLSPAARRSDRVYLKRMLLAESAGNLLPDWAFFAKAVVNANDLRPTASRESFYEDERLEQTRDELGDCLRDYLVDLARRRPEKFREMLALHHLAIAGLAVEDDECFRLFIQWLPFETTDGRLTLPEFLERHDDVRFIADVDQFRQVSRVAAAQGIGVINAGYTYTVELLTKYAELEPDVSVSSLEAAELAQSLEELDEAEEAGTEAFRHAADVALRSFRCATELRRFQPAELTALYSTNSEGRFLRSIEQSQETADSLWSGMLQNLANSKQTALPSATLIFNFENPLVQRLVALGEAPTIRPAVQMLYVQALLTAHQPLTSKEWKLMNDGLLALVEASVGSGR
jgi:molecular chaperone HtpG